jgi:hypothetical protein
MASLVCDYAPNSGTSNTVNVGNVSTSESEEEGTAVLATANGNMSTDHCGRSCPVSKKCDENPGHCSSGTAYSENLCPADVNSHGAAESLLMNFALFVLLPVTYSVIFAFLSFCN